MPAVMSRLQPATTGFTYGQNIWDLGKNGVILIDSNTMNLMNTPCVHQLAVSSRNSVLVNASMVDVPVMLVERVKDQSGKVTMDSSVYDAVKNQGELLIEHQLYGFGDPDLLGKIKPLPGYNNVYVMYTSYHTNPAGEWSPTALEGALREYCMFAHMAGIQNLSIYMSMVGMQYNRGIQCIPDPAGKMVNVPYDKWDISKLQTPEAGLPAPGAMDGVNPDILTYPHYQDTQKISKIVASVLPLGGHIQVVV